MQQSTWNQLEQRSQQIRASKRQDRRQCLRDRRELGHVNFLLENLKASQESIQSDEISMVQEVGDEIIFPNNFILEDQLPKLIGSIKKRQFVPFRTRLKIIKMRHGNQMQFDQKLMSVQKISNLVGFSRNVCYKILKEFEEGRIALRPQTKVVRRRPKLTSDQQKEICSFEYLKNWIALSLDERCHKIYEKYDVLICRQTLSAMYKKHGITKTQLKYYHIPAIDPLDLFYDRQEFCCTLKKLLADEEEILYFDESSFQLDSRLSKAWQPKKLKIFKPLPKKYGYSITLLVTLTSKNPNLIFKIIRKSNEDSISQYFMENFVNQQNRRYLVLDNLGIHKTAKVQQSLLQNNIVPFFTPVCSSQLNPAETVFAWVKQTIRKRMLDQNACFRNETDLENLIVEVCESLRPEILYGFSRSTFSIMNEVMDATPLCPPSSLPFPPMELP